MSKNTAKTSRVLLAVFGLVVPACPDDEPVEVSAEGGGTGGSEGAGEEGDETVGEESGSADDESGGAGGDDGGPPCGFEGMLGGPGPEDYELVEFPAVGAVGQHRVFVPSADCDFSGLYEEEESEIASPLLNNEPAVTGFSIFVYHPQDANGDWPETVDNRPAVFFSPANGTLAELVSGDGTAEEDHRYRVLMRTLVEAGFVVFAMQPTAENMNSGRRRSAMACTMIWARDEWDPGNRLSEYSVMMGHSRGGGGAYLLTEDLMSGNDLPDATEAPGLWSWRQCALSTLAQRFGESATLSEFTVAPITYSEAPPFVSIVSASDDDVRGQGVRSYDGRFSEALSGATPTVDHFDEVAVVIHGRRHQDWGGFTADEDPIGAYYVDQFLRWQLMGEDESRRRFMDLVDAEVDSCAFDDLSFADAADCNDANEATECDWDVPTTEVYHRGCTGPTPPAACAENPDLEGLGRPLIRADFAQGTQPTGADRYVIDSLERPVGSCELTTAGSQLLPSSSGALVSVTTEVDESGPCVCALDHQSILAGYTGPEAPEACDPGSDLGPPGIGADELGDSLFDVHEGGGMMIRYGDAFGAASVRWSFAMDEGDDGDALDISDYTHVSLRIGNVVVGVEQGGLNNTDCVGDLALDEILVSAEIEDSDGQGTHSLPLGRIVESDTRDVIGCYTSHFMQTVRIPIARYCADGEFDPYHATAITLHFDDPERSHVALVDSIELVRDPVGAALVPSCSEEELEECPSAPPSGWNCEATNTLVALETSCSAEPISGVCDPSDVEENEVELPVVDEGEASEFYGWVVNVPRGWIRDPEDLTVDETADVIARCVMACELEYSEQPDIAANCSESGAFAPALRNTPDRAARVSVSDARSDGSDLFVGVELDCDLRDTCADAFDEDLAIARPRRPTSMSQPLHRGEEWLVNVAGDVYADSPDAPSAVSVDLEGTIGFSHCASGNASGACPFYLGSLDLEMVDPLTLSLECGNSTEVHVLDSMSIRLAQPAFGIAPQGSQWRGFPAGALVFEAEGVVDGEPFYASGPADRDFKFIANNGWVQLQGAGGAYLELTMPCGEETAEVVAWLGFQAVSWPGTPPSVNITVPSQVTCPSSVSLTKTLSDSQSDIVSVRWFVDDVLLDESVTSISFTQAHTLKAVVRDSRGATYTKSKAVSCL